MRIPALPTTSRPYENKWNARHESTLKEKVKNIIQVQGIIFTSSWSLMSFYHKAPVETYNSSCPPVLTQGVLIFNLWLSLNLSGVRVRRNLFVLIKLTINYAPIKLILETHEENDKIRDTFTLREKSQLTIREPKWRGIKMGQASLPKTLSLCLIIFVSLTCVRHYSEWFTDINSLSLHKTLLILIL